MYKITDLKLGDLFMFDKKYGGLERFHSFELINGRYLIGMISIQYLGDVKDSKPIFFTWRDSDCEVFIPKFYLSEKKKTYGLPCVPVKCLRNCFTIKLNEINISDVFCSHDKYWYEYADNPSKLDTPILTSEV